jgi:hypothetical protein
MILPLSFPDCAFNATSSTQGGFTVPREKGPGRMAAISEVISVRNSILRRAMGHWRL